MTATDIIAVIAATTAGVIAITAPIFSYLTLKVTKATAAAVTEVHTAVNSKNDALNANIVRLEKRVQELMSDRRIAAEAATSKETS
jgi:hypothetical protein